MALFITFITFIIPIILATSPFLGFSLVALWLWVRHSDSKLGLEAEQYRDWF